MPTYVYGLQNPWLNASIKSSLESVFGEVLRRYRLRAKMSQMDLAARAGLHLNAVGFLERGQRKPTLETVFLLAKALDVKAETLIAAVEREKPTFDS